MQIFSDIFRTKTPRATAMAVVRSTTLQLCSLPNEKVATAVGQRGRGRTVTIPAGGHDRVPGPVQAGSDGDGRRGRDARKRRMDTCFDPLDGSGKTGIANAAICTGTVVVVECCRYCAMTMTLASRTI